MIICAVCCTSWCNLKLKLRIYLIWSEKPTYSRVMIAKKSPCKLPQCSVAPLSEGVWACVIVYRPATWFTHVTHVYRSVCVCVCSLTGCPCSVCNAFNPASRMSAVWFAALLVTWQPEATALAPCWRKCVFRLSFCRDAFVLWRTCVIKKTFKAACLQGLWTEV